jgi:cystathionine beta-lyase/cystathionine gamma-synthase
MSRAPLPSLATLCVHGDPPDPATGALATPIYQSTAFARAGLDDTPAYSYSRSANPTVAALERRLAALEGGTHAAAFSSGLAALTTLAVALLRAGDRVVATDVLYGGSFRLLRTVLGEFGVESEFIDTSSPERLARALERPARLVLLESPSNPTLKLSDLAGCAAVARRAGALVAVDNTFLTPCLQRPLALGADLVVHSTTKYVDGHNAAVGGAVVLGDAAVAERLHWTRQALGTIQTPFNAWLTLQGLRTLPLRVERIAATALAVARFLEGHPRVKLVAYPGLDSFPQRDLARRQQAAGGGIVAFELVGGLVAAAGFVRAIRLCRLAENLGATETLVTHPATMTHASLPPDLRQAAGIGDGLLRLSLGLEEPADVIADLEQALGA